MSSKQLILLIAATTVLALTLAWVIERTQIRNFRAELDAWGQENSGKSDSG